jgi:predicted permease
MNVSLDVRYGLRKLNNSAGFTAIAVFCLALGICASVTVFSVVNGLLLRPIPGVVEQDRLVTLISKPVEWEGVTGKLSLPLSYPDFLRYRQDNRAFSGLVAYQPLRGNLVVGGEPLRATGEIVTDNYFTALGVRPALGRLFTPGEGRREAQPSVVISHALWHSAFGGRGHAVGSAVNLNGSVFTVVGVAPEDFRGTVYGNEAEFWVPIETASLVRLTENGQWNDPGHPWLFWFFGRLRPGMDRQSAQQEMDRTAQRLWGDLPEEQRPPELQVHQAFGIRAGTLGDVASPLLLLSAVVALLMLVVCANLGGLLLVKAAARQEEIGVRLALGVTRGRLVRQLLTESVALALIGGTVGFLMALWTVDALQGVSLGKSFPRINHLAIDGRVVAFTLLLSLAAGIFFGLIPALWSTRRQVVPLLRRGGAAGGQDWGRTRMQEMLVVGQVMVSLLLLVITGLFVRTLRNLESIDPGFESSGILNVRIDLSLRGVPGPGGLDLYDQLLPQVRKLPGVRSAALASRVLLSVPETMTGLVELRPERGPAPGGKPLLSEFNVVSPGYFQTLEIPLVRGRDFSDLDRAGSPRVMIVDQILADALWPGRDPVGERVALGTRGEVREVVGVARNVRVSDLQGDVRPYFYTPLAQAYQPTLALQVKTVGDPLRSVDRIRAVLRKLDPSLAVQVSLFEDEFSEVLALPRFFSWIFGAYSLLAVVITATGLYGTLSYAVSRRTRELGIRMALGARASEIVVLVLRRGLGLTIAGLVLGLFAAAWTTSILTTRIFSGLLFGVAPTDPGVFVSVALLLALVGLAASSLPAYSATRVDPMAIIRHE